MIWLLEFRRVLFRSMTINSWSDTAIVFTIPSGATSGLLGVFVAPSMNASNTFMFTITTQPLAPTWLDQDIGKVGLAGSATYSNRSEEHTSELQSPDH